MPEDGENQQIFFLHSDDNGLTWVGKTSGLNLSQSGNFFVPYVTDPAIPGRLILGTSQVYESTNSGDSWHPLGSFVFPDIIDAVGAAPSDVNTVYATARGGHVFVTTDHGANWVKPTPSPPTLSCGTGAFSWIRIMPTSPTWWPRISTTSPGVARSGGRPTPA